MQCKVSSPSGCAILLLFIAWVSSCSGAPGAAGPRCQCVKTMSKPFNGRHIMKVELISSGPHCPRIEVIATLKTGQVNCLNPQATWVKHIINHILKRASRMRRQLKN